MTVTTGGEVSKESYDYGDRPTDESALLRLSSPTFDALTAGSSTTSKTLKLVYSDRFSSVDEESSRRIPLEMTVTYRKWRITGSVDASWVINSLKGDRMELEYDSGTVEEDGVAVRRQCKYVMARVGGR